MSITSAPDLGFLTSPPAAITILWPATPANDSVARAVEQRRIYPTLEHPVYAEFQLATPVSNWNAIGPSPVFASYGPQNEGHILFEALDHANDGSGGTFLTAMDTAASQELPYSKVGDERSGDLDAVTVSGNAAFVWADSSRGELATYRSTGEKPLRAAELQGALGGCCAYHPTLGVQIDGTPWVAWYSNASASTGLYMAPLDPATGAAAGPTVKVPGSESVANNFARLPLVCRATCRLFYATQPSAAGPTKLASWAPGDPAQVTIPGADDLTLNGVVTAAPAGDTKTWVAWYDRGPSGSAGGYRVTLGAENGSGGTPVGVPAPKGTSAFGPMLSLALSDGNVMLGAVAGPAVRGGAVWLDVVTPKGDPAIPNKAGFKSAKVVRAGNAIAVVSGRQSARAIRRGGLRAGLQATGAGSVTLSVCGKRPGHPPSPCKGRATRFKAAGFKTARTPRLRVKGKSLRLTLRAGGKSRTVSLKLRR